MAKSQPAILLQEHIVSKIFIVRGIKVMLDSDLAQFYGVLTKELNKAVSRNAERFPDDFMFQLTVDEFSELNEELHKESYHGGRRIPPRAFTEQGVAMLSSVLRSKRAVAVSVQIIRSFVKLRELLLTNEALARKVHKLEAKTDEHTKIIVQIINELHRLQKVN